MSTFTELGLPEPVLRALTESGYVNPTPIQAAAIPAILAKRDIIGAAQTGTGKTAAFALPTLARLGPAGGKPSCLVLVPTRELAIQVTREIREWAKHTSLAAVAIYGGQPIRTQAQKLEKKPAILVGTPGRVMDMHGRGLLPYDNVRIAVLDEVDRMLTRNAIWVGRTVGIGVMTPEEAINYGLSGPMLRASGVAYDVRKDVPYLDYETYDFDVPVGTNGDVYDRFLVRFEELRQSVRILEQALARLPEGPVDVDDPRVILPPKHKATSEMESMIHHFKLVMEGPRPPIGEAYVPVESPKGEKGYYFVSDGTAKPVRWRIRPPSYVNLSAIPRMVEGHLLSDVIAINASIDIVMGEIDR